MRTGSSIATQPHYMDAVEVGVYIGIVKELRGDPDPVGTRRKQLMRIYMMVHRKQIPHVKIGGRLFFIKAEIDAWMARGRVPVR